ncbi:MAG: 3'-5' exonuclease [Firmicutes bacterium]|nr:3'-5' exonuclease [Bacillota bacterium]MCM1400441.1 3'-5' exonuclease [Bacteroides sp.]MCM1476919.1 3'-5' exonuclease [Bacteroides sp.]
MQLKLQRPIVFFDLETTGTNVTRDRIVEISIIKVLPNGEEIERTRRINPEMPIPAEATAVHHITDSDVAGEPTFKQIAKSLAEMFADSDIAGFNSNRFDIPLLLEEFHRAGIELDTSKTKLVDVQTIYHKMEPRNLSAAYKFYCGKNLEDAHSASADTRATLEVLKAQLDRYSDLVNDVKALSEFSSHGRNVDFAGRLIYNDANKEVINFGKYKGQIAEEVLMRDPGYYSWIQQGDFQQNTKNAFARIKLRIGSRR